MQQSAARTVKWATLQHIYSKEQFGEIKRYEKQHSRMRVVYAHKRLLEIPKTLG
jgi:hypothetical protein